MAYYHWRAFARDVAVTCAGSMAMGLGLAAAADMAMPKKAEARPSELRLIERTVERAAGTRILWARGRTNGCNKSTLLGFYSPDRNRVIMCEDALRGACQRLLSCSSTRVGTAFNSAAIKADQCCVMTKYEMG